MSHLDGTTCEPLFDDVDCGSETVVAERFQNAAATLAQLHRIEPSAVGLASEPVIGPRDEVERWCRTLETVDAALVPGWREVATALRFSAPPTLPPAVVHGDFRLGNLLAVGDRITAVIDWEIWSVGDPRVDVGWFLINCDPSTYRRSTRYAAAVPSLRELATSLPRGAGTRSAGTGLVLRAGLLQVDRDVVADRQAQPPAQHAAPGTGGDDVGTAASALAGA